MDTTEEAPPKATDEKQPVPKRWFYMEGDQWIEAGEFPAMKWPLPPSTKTHLEQVVNGSLCQSANSMSSGETSDPYLPTHYYDEDGRLLWIRPRGLEATMLKMPNKLTSFLRKFRIFGRADEDVGRKHGLLEYA